MENITSGPEVAYIPSTVEKKKAIACILFMGMLMSLNSPQQLSVYESYYLSFSIGWWTIGLVVLIGIALSILVNFFLILSLPLFLVRLGLGIISLQQARTGVYNHTNSIFRFCVGVGSRLLSLFEIKKQ